MDLRSAIVVASHDSGLDSISIQAGGPGSGRHPGFGKFKYDGKKEYFPNTPIGRKMTSGKSADSYYQGPNGGHVQVTEQRHSSGWSVKDDTGHSQSGKGFDNLDNHLSNRYGIEDHEDHTHMSNKVQFQGKMAAERGCKGANCGRKSKAPGGGHLPKHSKVTGQEKDYLKSGAYGRDMSKASPGSGDGPKMDDRVRAGGPGSGRHKAESSEETAKAYGWKSNGFKYSGRVGYIHSNRPGHYLAIDKNGSWEHGKHGSGPVAAGENNFGLARHLEKFHGKS